MLKKKSRFIYMFVLGILVSLGLNFFTPGRTIFDTKIMDVIGSLLITIVVWEGNLRIDAWMNKRYPWIAKPGKRLMMHFLFSVSYSAVVIFLSSLVFNIVSNEIPYGGPNFFKIILYILASLVLMSMILLMLEVSVQFFNHWKRSLVEIEKYKAESYQAQLQNLKNQINPHFLFNNLSVLSSLVYQDREKSVEFIQQLSKVYRYLLDNQGNELVSLEEEMTFIQSYIYLLEIRFNPNLHISIHIPDEDLQKLIPPMALQILIENAIKHNEVSTENPLQISIVSRDGRLHITNNLQPRMQHESSSGTGLTNIMQRYRFFTQEEVRVEHTSNEFKVDIPLLTNP